MSTPEVSRQACLGSVDVTVNNGPVAYSQPIAEAICVLLAEGNSLRAICRMLNLAESTVRYWALNDPEFAAQSLRARELGCDALAEQTLEIADTPVEGVEVTETTGGRNPGTTTKRGDMLNHRRLQIDTRLRLIGKWHQHRYGDKVRNEHSGPDGKPIAHTFNAATASDDELAAVALGKGAAS